MDCPNRKPTKKINIGNVSIGARLPVLIQSMTNTDTSDVSATLRQIGALREAGCDIARVAAANGRDVSALAEIVKNAGLPIVADIHYDWRLAVGAVKAGAHKLRVNPGNIKRDGLKKIIQCAKAYGVPIRIGINGGSLEGALLKARGVTAGALAQSALQNIAFFEEQGFFDIVISVKSSDAAMCFDACRQISQKCDYPLHVGVTEAGLGEGALIKTSVCLGALLLCGIGDTIRVSLTENPVNEVILAKKILRACNLRTGGINFISCPTCARTKTDLIGLAEAAQRYCAGQNKNMTVAVMGCAVNGPGEAAHADVGIACGSKNGVLFKNGKIIAKLPESELLPALVSEIEKFE